MRFYGNGYLCNGVMNNSFGNKFIISIFGASHAPETGVVVSGVPSGLVFSLDDYLKDILRRKSGGPGTTPRIESDLPRFSGGLALQKDGTLISDGTDITISFENKDIRPQDYASFEAVPRPGHADFVAYKRFHTLMDGFFSGRMTLPLVAAGVIAKKIVAPTSIHAGLVEVGGIAVDGIDSPDLSSSPDAGRAVAAAAAEGDSLGGVVECRCSGLQAGLGEPFFDSVESLLSHAMFSIPGIRGIEFGDGFAASRMRGSEHNDPFIDAAGRTAKNGCGGINGGLTNGNDIVFRIAVKPTSSISKPQTSFNFATGEMARMTVPGRHDACFALRVPPVVEALTACVLADMSFSMKQYD